jgi:hypothetical protein
MKPFAAIAFTTLLSLPAIGIAQDSLIGKYSASYTSTGIASTLQSVSITISSVENGVVKATGYRSDSGCRGEYQLQGKVKDNNIRLLGKGGPAGDCVFGINGTIDGNAIVAKWGPHDLRFTK